MYSIQHPQIDQSYYNIPWFLLSQGLYIISNYLPNIEHLPGVIEVDVLDSFKILCRRLGRMTDNAGNDNNNPKGATISTEKLHPPR
jgi:hypothetical protein